MKKQLLKPKYAFPDNEGWAVVCENNAHRTVTNGQFIHAFGEPKGRLVDVYDNGVFVHMDDMQYIEYLNLRFNRDKLLAYLMDIINTEAAKVAMIGRNLPTIETSIIQQHRSQAEDNQDNYRIEQMQRTLEQGINVYGLDFYNRA